MIKHTSFVTFFLTACLLLFTFDANAVDREYKLIDLGYFDHNQDQNPFFSVPRAINESAQIVGGAGEFSPNESAFEWGRSQGMVYSNLPASGNLLVRSWGSDINDSGDIAGIYHEAKLPLTNNEHGFFRSNNASVSIPDFLPKKISNSGVLIGTFVDGPNFGQTGTWQNGNLAVLPFSFVSDINNSDMITGNALFDSGLQAAIWEGGQLKQLNPLVGHSASSALAINDMGEVAGLSMSAGGSAHLVKWSSETALDLGVLPVNEFNVAAFNKSNQMVGSAVADSDAFAAMWEGGEFLNLNSYLPTDSAWHLATAYDVNEYGQIIGFGYVDGYPNQRGYLLEPIVTPEPVSALLFLAGSGLMGFHQRKKFFKLSS